MDNKEYLQPDFDAKSLKVAQLRGLLLEYDVEFPSSAKKSELVDIFNLEIKPRAAELLKQADEVTADSTGIINASSPIRKVESDDKEELEDEPEKKPKKKASSKDKVSKKSKKKTEIDESKIALVEKKSKKKLVAKAMPLSDEDTTTEDIKTPVVASDKKTPEPVIPQKRGKSSDVKEEPEKKKVSKKSTTIEEKFEQGPDIFKKSPPSTPKVASAKKQKLTSPKVEESFQSIASVTEEDESFKSVADASKQDIPTPKVRESIAVSPEFAKRLGKQTISTPLKNEISSTPKGPKTPLTYVDEKAKVNMEVITPSIDDEEEEFKKLQEEMSVHLEETKEEVEKIEEELEIQEVDKAVSGAVYKVFQNLMFGIIYAFLSITTFVVVAWYFDQKNKIGFCGFEVESRTFKVTNYDQFDFEGFLNENFAPHCVPCPPHGHCGAYLYLECEEDFIKTNPWYSFGGLYPFAPMCVPDKMKQQRIDDMVSYTLDLLRDRNGENCGKDADEVAGLSSAEIHDILKNSQDETISDEKFEELWSKVLKDLKSEPEIIVRQLRLPKGGDRQDQDSVEDKEGQENEIVRSVSKVKFSMKCKLQEVVYKQLVRFRYVIAAIFGLVIVVFVARRKYHNYIKNKAQIDKFTSIITKKLVQQNKNAAKDTTGLTRDYLALVQLRDVLIDNADKNKSKLWDQIVKIISRNSNIEERTIEVGGEIIKIWKWIGVDIDDLDA